MPCQENFKDSGTFFFTIPQKTSKLCDTIERMPDIERKPDGLSQRNLLLLQKLSGARQHLLKKNFLAREKVMR
jgi:hypothetical protein